MNARTAAAALALLPLLSCAARGASGPRAAAPPPLPPSAAPPAPPAPPPPPPEPPGLKDADLGLARGTVFETLTPPPVQPERSEPGEKPVVPRAFAGWPPVVPHELVDYTPITRKENACLGCHEIPGPKVAGQPTPIPPTHFTDYRRAPGKVGKKLAGARWVCTACHVSRTDQGPLVPNAGK